MAALTPRLQNIRQIYDTRAPVYDTEEGFHPSQVRDYLLWTAPPIGSKILDLACGTGALSVLFAEAIGPTGTVIGIDISPASLDIAREKVKKRNFENARFLEGDIVDLEWLGKEGVEKGSFDFVTCASAFVLLEDPKKAVQEWKRFLKKGGKMIFDVPTGDSMLKGLLLERVAAPLGIVQTYSRAGLDSEEKVRGLLKGAGLDDGEFFISKSYEDGEVLTVAEAGEWFDERVGEGAKGKWFRGWYDVMNEPGIRDKARELFCKEVEKVAGGKEEVKSLLRFYMAVGKKV